MPDTPEPSAEEAYQRLVSAAPDLLAALRRLVTATAIGFEERDEAEEGAAWDQAQEAIAKATMKPG